MRVGDDCWYWYQRYHHLLVDGFSFPAITRQIAAIYRARQCGEETPDSPFTPFAEVVEEYQRYYGSEAWQRDKSLLAGAASGVAFSGLAIRRAAGRAGDQQRYLAPETGGRSGCLQPARRQRAAVPTCRSGAGADDVVVGAVVRPNGLRGGLLSFMRRMGSAALTATGPVLNVLPLAVNIDAQETLAQLATRLSGQLKKMRRHQRYDAEQIVRDSGKAAGDEPLFGPVLNIKVFDYQLDIDDVQAQTHTLATGPVNDLELALFPDERGGLSLEILANKARYDEATLNRHVSRLTALLAQFAANPALRCGEAEMLSAEEGAQLALINNTAMPLPTTTLSALVAEQARKNAGCPGAGGCQLAL